MSLGLCMLQGASTATRSRALPLIGFNRLVLIYVMESTARLRCPDARVCSGFCGLWGAGKMDVNTVKTEPLQRSLAFARAMWCRQSRHRRGRDSLMT